MSKTVDERVVEMRFDNSHFERNVQTSMSTLDKLKQKLNLSGAAKGLDEIDASARKIDMSGLGKGVETVQMKFSALQVMATTALANITNSAVNAGRKLVSSITLDPIRGGFQEYETQMNSVQTILANTSKEGTTVKDVNKSLDELNTYADKTIYNFTEMTRNIGTFTAAGVKLDDSVNAIQGIANLAAVSGSNSQQASTAMYQLSQALAAGKVNLQDWNSVVNAGMGGKVFQDALIRTSEHLKTGAKNAIKAKGSFRASISTGWMTQQVLTETLSQFSTAAGTQKEYEAAVKKFVKQGYTKQEAKEMADMARTAGNAATKVKTFTQLIDTLKEALGSGWTKTWQLIIGDFEEAKSLWTSVSDVLGGFINKMSDARNKIVQSAMGKTFIGLSKRLQGITEPAKKVSKAINDIGKVANKVINGDFGNGKKRFDSLTKAGVNYYKVQNKVNEKLGNSKRYTEAQIKAQDKLLGSTNKSTSATGKLTKEKKNLIKKIAKMTEEQMRSKGYSEKQIKAFKELGETADKLGMPLDEFINKMDKITGRWLLINSFKNIGKSIVSVFKTIGNAWRDTFEPMSADKLFDIIAAFHKITQSMKKFTKNKENVDKLTRTFKGLFAAIDIVRTVVGGGVRLAFKLVSLVLKTFNVSLLDVTANLGDAIVKFRDFLFTNNLLVKGAELLASGIKFVATKFKELFDTIKNLPKVQEFLTNLKKIDFKSIGENIISGLQNGLKNGITSVPKMLVDLGMKLLDAIKKVLGIHSPSKEMYDVGTNIIDGLFNGIKNGMSKVVGIMKNIGTKCLNAVKNIDWSMILTAGAGVGMLISLNKILDIMGSFGSIAEGIGSVLEGAGSIMKKSAKSIKKILNNTAKVVKSFSKVLNAKAFKIKTEAIKDLAISLGILAASVYLLAQLDAGKLWSSVGAIAVLAVIMIGLSIAVDKISKASMSINKDGVKVAGVQSTLLMLGVCLLLMAQTVKVIGTMSTDQANRGFLGLLGLVTSLMLVIGAFGLLTKADSAGNIDKLGSMLLKLSVAMLLMVAVVKAVGKLSPEAMGKGAAFAAAFVVFVGLLSFITSFSGRGIDGLGGMVLKISIAMLLMVGVVKSVGKLSPEEMGKGAAFAAAFLVFVGRLALITNFSKSGSGLGSTLMGISVSMLLLVGVVKLVGKLSPEEMKKGALFAAGFLVFLAILVKVTTLDGELAKVGGTVLAVSVAIGLLAGVCVLLGMVKTEVLLKGVAAVYVFGALTTAMILATKDAKDCKGNILAMAAVIGIMALAVAALSFIEPTKLIAPTLALTMLIGMFALMEKMAANVNGSMKTMVTMAVIVALLGGLLIALSVLPTDRALVAAGALSFVLLALSGTMYILSNTGDISAKTMVTLALMTAIVLALSVLLTTLTGLASMPISNIVASMVMLAGSLILIAAAVNLMNGAVSGAAALLIVSAALAIFLPVMQQLGQMSLAEVGTSLLMLAGTFAILGVAGLALGPVAPILIIIGGAIALIGAGALMAGMGVKAFAEGLESLAKTGPAGILVLVNSILILVQMIPTIISTLIVSIVKSITKAIPQIAEAGVLMIESLLTSIVEHLPKILSAGLKIITTLLKGIRDNIQQIVEIAVDIALNFIKGITKKLPAIIQAGVDLIFAFIDGISDAIANNGDRARKALVKLGKSMLKGIKDFFGIHSPSKKFIEIGKQLIEGLKNGVKDKVTGAVNTVVDLGKKMVNGIADKGKEFLAKGKELGSKLKDGIGNKADAIKSAATKLVSKASKAIRDKYDSFKKAGSHLVSGLKKGIESGKDKIKSATKGLADNVVGKFKDLLGIASPSKVFIGFGKYIDEGLAKGLKKYASKASNATSYVGKRAIKGMLSAMSQISDLIDGGMETQPSIRPVVDLSDVKTGVGAINKMMAGNHSIGLKSEVSTVSTMMSNRQNGNYELLNAIKGLRKDMSSGGNNISLNVQMDYNAGSDANDIANDIAMNLQRAIRRGV